MANQKISQLTDLTAAQAGDKIPVSRAGSNGFITPAYIAAMMLAGVTAGVVMAGPTTGGPGAASFRSLVASDIPDLSSLYVTPAAQTSALNGYATTAAVNSALSNYTTSAALATTLNDYALKTNVTANRVLAGPATGSPGTATYRSLVAADIPDLSSAYITPAALTTALTGYISSSNPTLTGTVTLSSNISAVAWTTSGIRLRESAGTLTDTSSAGTVAAAYTHKLGGSTIAASSATTFSDYYSTFISEPTAGSNVTLTRKWALGLGGGLSIAAQANASVLASTGYSLTGSDATSMVSLAGTLNTTGSPDVFKIVVTDTNRGASTRFLNIYGGASGITSIFSVDRTGQVRVAGSTSFSNLQTGGGIVFSTGTVIGSAGAGQFSVGDSAGATRLYADTATNGYFQVDAGHFLGFAVTAGQTYNAGDVRLYRDAANTHAWRNSTSAQTSRIYSTYTDASNGAWGFIDSAVTTAATLTIGTSGNGTGASTLGKFQVKILGTTKLDYAVTAASTWTLADTLQLGSTSSALKVGTHSAIGAETVTGYVTLKDSAGNDRKFAVVS